MPALGALQFVGADAERFLQGQLSNDLARCDDSLTLFAGLHNPQGRVLALMHLARRGDEEITAAMPRELLAAIAAHLQRYVLRARVRIAPAPLAVEGHWFADGSRRLALVDVATPASEVAAASVDKDAAAHASDATRHWHLADLDAGVPEVFAATSGQFIAQQLNLDRLEAIAFDKGCYTGQEIIARAHYRGQVRRRMELIALPEGEPPAPGAELQLRDGGKAVVVDSERRDDGALAVLAVPKAAPT